MPETIKLSRSEQARINGAKSEGPVTPQGKAISSTNALKHGFAATINVVLAIENESDFLLHVAGVRASFTPTNYMEETLVDQLANISWRQARLVALESALIAAQMSLHDANVCATHPHCADDSYFHLVQAWRALASPPHPRIEAQDADPTQPPVGYDITSIELLRRYQTSLDRQFRNTLLNLRQYRKDFAPVNVSFQNAAAAQQNEPNVPQPPSPEIDQATASQPKATPSRPPTNAQTSHQDVEAKPESTPVVAIRVASFVKPQGINR